MSNAEQREQGDRRLQAVPEVKPLQTADAQAARVAGSSDVEAAQALNPNRHNGSAGGDQELSFELIAYGNEGFGKVVAARQPERLNARSDQKEQMDTGTMLAVEAKTNPAAEPVKLFKEWLNKQPESPQKEALKQEVRQQAADLSPEMKARMEHLAAVRRRIDEAGLEEGGIHQAITPEMASRTKLEGQVRHNQPLENTADGWLEAGRRISELPIDRQLQVIGSGLMAGYEQYQHDERERTWGRIIGTTEGLGAIAVNLATIAEFTCDCIAGNKERAAERGGKFGEAVGQTLVSGVKLFQDADAYLFKVGFDGDYGRPFRDLVTVGAALNDRWSQLPPREQERVKYKLITEMAADGLIGAGGAKAIGKAKVFTEVLDAIALEAKTATKATIEGGKRAAKAIGSAIDGLVQEEVEIVGVGKVKYPRDFGKPADKPLTHVLMSQVDDLGGAARPGRLLVNGKDGALIKFENLKHLEISETVGDASNSHWTGANFLTGWKVEGTLKDKFMAAGEALRSNFPVIDGWSYKNGLITSIKSIDLRATSYQKMDDLERTLRTYLGQVEKYEGTTDLVNNINIRPERISQRLLHLGIPEGSITPDQKTILEKLARELESSGSDTEIKVTLLR